MTKQPPTSRATLIRRAAWIAAAAWLVLARGPEFARSFWPARGSVPDFFQEYSSARNLFNDRAIYQDMKSSLHRYLIGRADPTALHVEWNAHPPAAVLMVLPFAGLDFDDAFLVWNFLSVDALVISLWIACRALRIGLSPWSLCHPIVLLLLCHPLWEHMRQGQLNLVLLLLLTGMWASERSGRPRLAGVLLGLAAAIKLFPGFFFIHYAMRRRWRVVAAGAATLAATAALASFCLGRGIHRTYFLEIVPRIAWFRSGWNNASISGFWGKLFDPVPAEKHWLFATRALVRSPSLAYAGTLLCSAAVIALLARRARSPRGACDGDRSFAMACTAMLITSPITWEHYFLLLIPSLMILWETASGKWPRCVLVLIAAALWVDPSAIWGRFVSMGDIGRPIHSVSIFAFQFYALLALFLLAAVDGQSDRRAAIPVRLPIDADVARPAAGRGPIAPFPR